MIKIDPTEDKIVKFLEDDSLGRNEFVCNLLRIVESVEDGAILDLNGYWGSGKTVIAKSIELLNTMEKPPKTMDADVVSTFNEDYLVFYYNAWENDQYDPAESIVFQLITSFYGAREKIAKKVLSAAETFVTRLVDAGLRQMTGGLVSVDCIQGGEQLDNLTNSVKVTDDKREAAADIVCDAIEQHGKKKLLILIDELDRCNPNFAVKLIEVIKHYFSGESVKVLFLTNNRQLSSIIENNYGENFSGYEYLDKIFDLIIDIPMPERRKFIDMCASDLETYQRDAINGIAEYYDMSLREMERYIVLYRISQKYLQSTVISIGDGETELKYFVRHLFLPLILGAKIKNQNDFYALVSWKLKGQDVIKKVATEGEYGKRITRRCNSSRYMTSLDKIYGQLMNEVGEFNYEAQEIRRLVAEMISMIGASVDGVQ